MTQEMVTISLPFEIIVTAISHLKLKENRQLLDLLNEQLAQVKEIQESPTTYLTENEIAEESSPAQILLELKKLPTIERLAIIETMLHLIRKELQQADQTSQTQRKQALVEAAQSLISDYQTNRELTAFTTLDGEDFYASG